MFEIPSLVPIQSCPLALVPLPALLRLSGQNDGAKQILIFKINSFEIYTFAFNI